MPTRRQEEIGAKFVLDAHEALATIDELEARLDALTRKMSGVASMAGGSGMAAGMGAPTAGMGTYGAGMGYNTMAGALPVNGGGAGLPFAGMALTAGLGAAAGAQLAANAQRGVMALGAATPSPFSTPGSFWDNYFGPPVPGGASAAPSMQDLLNKAGIGDPTTGRGPSAGGGPGVSFLNDVDTNARFGAAKGAGLIPESAQLDLPFGDTPPGGPRNRSGERGFAINYGAAMFEGAQNLARNPLVQASGATFGIAAAGIYATDAADTWMDSYNAQTSSAVRQIQSGRAPQPWDDAVADRKRSVMGWRAVGAGAAAVLGGLAGSVAGPAGTFGGAGAAVAAWQHYTGSAIEAVGNRDKQIGEANFSAEAAARDLALSTGQNVAWNAGAPMSSIEMLKARRSLSLGLMGGHGQGGAALAGRLSSMAVSAAGDHPELAAEWIQRLSTGVDAFTSPLVNSGSYSQDALFALAQKSPDVAQTYATLHGKSGDLAGAIEKAQGIVRQAKTIEGAGYGIAGAEADVRGVTARGGNASQIGRAMDAEIAAVGRAKAENDKYIQSLEAIKTKTVEQSAELERAKAAAAGFTATISEIRYAATRMKSDESLDIAGTRSNISGSRLPERLAGARRGDATLFTAALDDLAGEADTIANELRRPGLKPEDVRRLKRQQASTQAALFGMERESIDYMGGEGSRFADLGAQGASMWGRLVSMNNGDPSSIAQTNRNVSWRQGEAMWQSSGYLSFMKQNPRYYSDEAVKAQENVVLGNKVAYAESAVTAGAAPFTAGMQNELEGLDLQTRQAMRNGGSLAALNIAAQQKGFWNNRIGAINRTADEQARITPQFRRAIMDRRDSDVLGARNALFALEDLEGVYSPTPEMSMAYENARTEYAIQQNDIFRPGDRRQASMARMAPVRAMIEQVQAQMEGATPANKARLTRSLNALRVEESEIGRSETEGWMGRVLEYESNRPSHAALFAPTHKDLIRFKPDAGRMFGAGDRESAERMRDRRVYGQSDATNRPGQSGAQELRVVMELKPLTIDVRMPDGTIQRQTTTPQARHAVQSDPRQNALNERAR